MDPTKWVKSKARRNETHLQFFLIGPHFSAYLICRQILVSCSQHSHQLTAQLHWLQYVVISFFACIIIFRLKIICICTKEPLSVLGFGRLGSVPAGTASSSVSASSSLPLVTACRNNAFWFRRQVLTFGFYVLMSSAYDPLRGNSRG